MRYYGIIFYSQSSEVFPLHAGVIDILPFPVVFDFRVVGISSTFYFRRKQRNIIYDYMYNSSISCRNVLICNNSP